MIDLLFWLGVGLVALGVYFGFAHPYTRARSYARSKFFSGGGNFGAALIVLGLSAIVISIIFNFYFSV